MNFVELVKAIAEVGILVVISAVMIAVFVRMFKNQETLIKELKDEVLNKGGCSQEHPDEEDFEMLDLINSKIHTELSLLLQALSCDRSYIYLYHNGGVSSSGLFFQRMSCISEVVAPGVLPVSQTSQNLHRSSYSRMLGIVQEKGEWYSDDVQELRDADGFLYQRMRSTHTESVYVSALRSSQGHVIGFIGVDYCSLNHDTDSRVVIKTLRRASSVVSTLVDIRGEVSSDEKDSNR